jgi:hypothetical protein
VRQLKGRDEDVQQFKPGEATLSSYHGKKVGNKWVGDDEVMRRWVRLMCWQPVGNKGFALDLLMTR